MAGVVEQHQGGPVPVPSKPLEVVLFDYPTLPTGEPPIFRPAVVGDDGVCAKKWHGAIMRRASQAGKWHD